MPKYLARVTYTADGLQGLIEEGGAARRDAITTAVESVGARWKTCCTPWVKTTSISYMTLPTTPARPRWVCTSAPPGRLPGAPRL